MKRKGLTLFLAAALTAVTLSGCRGASDIEFSDAEAAKDALNSAQTIYLEGGYATPTQKTDILADGKVAAYLKDTTVSIDGETWFKIDFVTDEWINEDSDDYNPATTYGYFDADGNCLGYAQERSIRQGDDFIRRYYFMDAEGNLRDYSMHRNGYTVWDKDENVIATGDWDPDFRITFMNDSCHVQIDMAEDATTQMDFMDKMVMYLQLFDEAEFWLRD